MNINLHPPLGIHEQGRRNNNEDCIYPINSAGTDLAKNNIFLVCDGVGGLEKGEVASRIVCETLWDLLRHEENINGENINSALRTAEQRMDQYISQNREAKGMATTLTLLALHQEGVAVAHVGDSRVYHIRDGKILFKTSDHSLVNDLIAKQIITEEEALNHPKRNVITRAISGYDDHQEADITVITDVQKGDYFFLCTDGILESISDVRLLEILGSKNTNEAKIGLIKNDCSSNSRDNYSAYLLQIKKIGKQKKLTPLIVNKGGRAREKYLAVALVFAIGAGLFLLSSTIRNKKEELRRMDINASLEELDKVDTIGMELDPAFSAEYDPIDSLTEVFSNVDITDGMDAPQAVAPDVKPKPKPKSKPKATKEIPKEKPDANSNGSIVPDSYVLDEARDLNVTNEKRKRDISPLPSLDRDDDYPRQSYKPKPGKSEIPKDSTVQKNQNSPVKSKIDSLKIEN